MLFWAEGHHGIGLGHVYECMHLARTVSASGTPVSFAVSAYAPAHELLAMSNFVAQTSDTHDAPRIVALAHKEGHQIVVVNHRAVAVKALRILRDAGLFVAVIDQLGGRQLVCNAVINAAPIPEWHRYEYEGEAPQELFGPSYALLPSFFAERKDMPRNSGDLRRILVTMGGVDRTGATLRIVQALAGVPGVEKDVVVGPGFPFWSELNTLAAGLNDPHLNLARAVTDIHERMHRADVAISAGGNTLYELACLGTPAIVLWEDSHEDILGRAFAKAGCALHLGNGIETSLDNIRLVCVDLLATPEQRRTMSKAGQGFVDGKGTERTVEHLKTASSGQAFMWMCEGHHDEYC